jgi:membrane dipeptidase
VAQKYWPPRQYPAGLNASYVPPSALSEVPDRLNAMGYKEAAVRAIMGGNFMRVASQVWAS